MIDYEKEGRHVHTLEDAVAFLESHQPLPDENQLTALQAKMLDECSMFFREDRDGRLPELIFGAMGEGEGFGVYESVGNEMVSTYPYHHVVRAILWGLGSEHPETLIRVLRYAGMVYDARVFNALAELEIDPTPTIRRRWILSAINRHARYSQDARGYLEAIVQSISLSEGERKSLRL